MTDSTPPASFSRVRRINRKIRPPAQRKKTTVKRPTFIDVVFHRRNQRRTQYYLTSGHEHLGDARNVNEEQSPFTFPTCSQTFAYYQYWRATRRKLAEEQRRSDYKEQHSYKTLQSRDVLQRLRVDVEIEAEEAKKHKAPDKATAMTDVDPGYFTELSGRVVKEKFSVRQYIEDTREVLRSRLLAGHQRDDCIHIEEQFAEEQRRLDKIKGRYRRYVAGFEEFLAKDHARSMEVLERADDEARVTKLVSQRRNQLSREVAQERLEVYHWEEKWRLVKMCQKFLYQVSPISWRLQHDWIHRSESGATVLSTTTDGLFARYDTVDEAASLDSLIGMFEQDVFDAGPAEIYFEDPNELIQVFRSMETQNLNALIHLESLAAPMASMSTTINEAETQIKSEVAEISNSIKDLETAVRATEERVAKLQEQANSLLFGVFRELVCSEEVLHLYVFVEDTYESCVAPNAANLDSFTMMKQIEKLHEDLNLQLDTLPRRVVEKCERDGFRQEMKAMKEAEDAAKKFELMHRLLASIKRMMEPPLVKGRPLMQRSAPILLKAKEEPPTPEPTEEERQLLEYFTDYCRREDFAAYRSMFPEDFDLTFEPRRPHEFAGDAEAAESDAGFVTTPDS